MPQLNPIPWIFFFILAWSVFLFFSVRKFSETYSPIMNQDYQPAHVSSTKTSEFTMPW
uniref:ATP synthase complex subunit 8 n=1 Tax=Asymmetron lucayanum TaxID=223987 RepID=A0A182C2G8_9BRAN|nr:ATP synthase subunit 8 [Asymmetron lucayanum]BAV13709.1 ATP synthase subunit 8 [Asymmetron lucayanum]BAV13735.1 ATP synthase subunit 8 [Asymmetron lucayanum]BAV13748.1 ATP synthase subunit 8 [Asymmetron lucayanum]